MVENPSHGVMLPAWNSAMLLSIAWCCFFHHTSPGTRSHAALISVSVEFTVTVMEVFTFWPVSVVIAKPLGTSPAVLCFFTSLTETTGIATYMENDTKTAFIKETLRFMEINFKADNEEIIDDKSPL